MTRVAITYPTAAELRSAEGPYRRATPADRLAKAYVIESNGCWRWVKGRTSNGYGHFSIRSIYYQAHRLTYILRFGVDIPVGLFPDHLCRNRWCVNPDHLEPVTHAVNVQRGTQTHLTPEQVDEIRVRCARGEGQRAIAGEYGIDHSTISKLVRGLLWTERPFPVDVAA